MRDNQGNPIEVHTDGTSGPHILVPVERTGELLQALADAGVPSVQSLGSLRMNDQPSEDIVNLGHGADMDVAQAVLDALD